MTVWAIVVAAGAGSRFGGFKQFEALGPRRVVDWAVLAARTVADRVIVVIPPGWTGGADLEADVVVTGASTRSGSVRAGLDAVPAEVGVVVVHDAARPLASEHLFATVVAAMGDADVDGAVPVLALADTVKRVVDGVVVETLDRRGLVAVQTPQAFRTAILRRAHAGGLEATDDAALVERCGGRIVAVPGEAVNAKLTRLDDLEQAQAAFQRRLAGS